MTDRKRPRLNVTLDAGIKEEIESASEELGVPISRLIEEVLREFLDSYGEDPMIGRRLHKQIQERKRGSSEEEEPSETVKNILERMDEVD